jgi:hypothetical protein
MNKQNLMEDAFEEEIAKSQTLAEKMLPMIVGGAISGLARATGVDGILIAHMIAGGLWFPSPRYMPRTEKGMKRVLLGSTKYAIGSTLPYADKLYTFALQNYDNIVNTFTKGM